MAEITYPTSEEIQANIKKWNIPMPQQDYMVVVQCSTYNHEKYIEDALKGFVMQKTNFSFCALVTDDCSTDGTADIIKKYAAEYPDIIIPILLGENHMQHKKSRDPYIGPWHKRAKYFAICEGDDYWTDPMKLQKQVDFLEEHNEYGFVGTNVVLRKKDLLVEEKPVLLSDNIEGDFVLMGDVFETAKYGPVARTVSLLYRKGIEQYNGYTGGGDIVLESILAKQSKYAYYKKYACVYRQGVGISTSNNNLERAIRYNDWYVNCRRIQNKLFPMDCSWPEDELEDRGTYLRLLYAIREGNWKMALNYKKQIKSQAYRKKTYYRFLYGPISCAVLWVALRLKHHE